VIRSCRSRWRSKRKFPSDQMGIPESGSWYSENRNSDDSRKGLFFLCYRQGLFFLCDRPRPLLLNKKLGFGRFKHAGSFKATTIDRVRACTLNRIQNGNWKKCSTGVDTDTSEYAEKTVQKLSNLAKKNGGNSLNRDLRSCNKRMKERRKDIDDLRNGNSRNS
jgi:hypothetical protein